MLNFDILHRNKKKKKNSDRKEERRGERQGRGARETQEKNKFWSNLQEKFVEEIDKNNKKQKKIKMK